MSSIRQYQRRAIESLWRSLSVSEQNKVELPKGISERSRFVCDGQEVCFWGVSPGVGTCADIPGLNVAVFGDSRPAAPSRLKLEDCKFAVLLRCPRPGEGDNLDICYLVVELIAVERFAGGATYYFKFFKGLKQIYADI